MQSFKTYIQQPRQLALALLKKCNFLFSDKTYLKLRFRLQMGYKLNLDHPQTFNEKLQWLKLYDRQPIYTTMVDKYAVKQYVANIIGEQYIIPTLAVYNTPEEIDFDALPNQFVLKTTHSGGSTGVVICRDKSHFDRKKALAKLSTSLKADIYKTNREWPYKDVPKRIIAEKYIENSSKSELYDYKFFCFGGECRCMKVDFDRFIQHHANYYDVKGNILHFGEADLPPIYDRKVAMPTNLNLMIQLVNQLSQTTPFLRTDLYDIDGKIYFGELTFYPASGMGHFTSDEWDSKLGQWLKIPDISTTATQNGNNRIWGGQLIVYEGVIILLQTTNKNASYDNVLNDYKFYCFNGKMGYMLISQGRFTEHTYFDYFDKEFNHLPFTQGANNSPNKIDIPDKFAEMVKLAEQLSAGLPHVRVDLYNINGIIYFGELTFFDSSGFEKFEPSEWDYHWGKQIALPSKNNKTI